MALIKIKQVDGLQAALDALSGDVVGPASATDNAIVRYDSTTGKLIQDSGILISDTNQLTPATSDSGALGTSTLMWSDLFLASGSVINFNNGDCTITHSNNVLTIGGAALGTRFEHAIGPTASDGAALGSASLPWSDLHLATGAVINFANGNVTLTHSSGALAVSGTISASNLSGTNTGDDIINDTTPQLGGYLDLNSKGLTAELTAATGNTFAEGEIGYVASGGVTKADASAESTAKGMMVMALEAVSAEATGTFLIKGFWTTTGLTAGGEYYLSETAAAMTTTKPTTSTSIVRIVGYAVSTTQFFFDPDKTYVENT